MLMRALAYTGPRGPRGEDRFRAAVRRLEILDPITGGRAVVMGVDGDVVRIIPRGAVSPG
jgi:hypothetical protein